MTRMERRRRRVRRRRLQILVVALVVTLFISLCNAFVEAEDQNVESLTAREPTYTVTTLDFQQQEAGFRLIGDYKPITLEVKHTTPVEDDDTIIVKAEETEEPAETEPVFDRLYTEEDVIAAAQMMYGEAYITHSDMKMAATLWVVCNRYDSGDPYYRNCHTIKDFIAQPGAFYGYDPNGVIDEHLVWLARDVLDRWCMEKAGYTDVGRVIPKDYEYFHGDGWENHFRKEYEHDGNYWDWSLPNPYES